jgi:dihydrofolate reductase
MAAWEFPSALEDQADYIRDFATNWRAAEKMVFSRTLKEPFTKRTRIVSQFDPAMVRSLKATSDRDISVGGPELAASAIQEGLVDEWQLFLSPVVVGGGASAYPHSRKSKLELLEQRRFKNGTTFLRYATRT